MVCVALSILFGMPTQEAFARESLKWLREYAFSKRTYLKIGRVWQYRQLPVWSLCSCSSCTPSSLNHIRKFVEVISSHTKQNTAALTVGTLQGPHKEGLGVGNAVWLMWLITSNVISVKEEALIKFSSCCVLWCKALYLGIAFPICWLIHVKNKRMLGFY